MRYFIVVNKKKQVSSPIVHLCPDGSQRSVCSSRLLIESESAKEIKEPRPESLCRQCLSGQNSFKAMMERKEAGKTGKVSKTERMLMDLLGGIDGLPHYETQFSYASPRGFKADVAFPEYKLLIEAEGGVWGRISGHNSGSGIESDCERTNAATIAGYSQLRFTTQTLRDYPKYCRECVTLALRRAGWKEGS